MRENICNLFSNASSIISEFAALPVAIVLYPFGYVNSNPRTLSPSTKRITVLVHGFLHNRSAWLYIKSQLEKDPGLGPMFTINLGSPLRSIDEYTDRLQKFIENIRDMSSQKKLEVNLVGHSMGGLVCANYAARLMDGLDEPGILVKKVVTIASPLQGTPLSHIAKFCPCVTQMLPKSPFLTQLNAKVKKLPDNTFFHIGCHVDLMVYHTYTFFDGSENQREVKGLGHIGCLYSLKTVDYIREGLSV